MSFMNIDDPSVAKSPDTPSDVLIGCALYQPEATLENPQLPLLSLEDPQRWRSIVGTARRQIARRRFLAWWETLALEKQIGFVNSLDQIASVFFPAETMAKIADQRASVFFPAETVVKIVEAHFARLNGPTSDLLLHEARWLELLVRLEAT